MEKRHNGEEAISRNALTRERGLVLFSLSLVIQNNDVIFLYRSSLCEACLWFFFISARYIIRMLSSIPRVKLHIKRIAYIAEFRHIDLSADSSVKSSINK